MPAAIALRTKTAPVDNCGPAGTDAAARPEPTGGTTRATDRAVLASWAADRAVLASWTANGALLTTSVLTTSVLASTEITRPLAATTGHRARSRTVSPALLTLAPLNLDDRGASLIAHHTLVRGENRRIR